MVSSPVKLLLLVYVTEILADGTNVVNFLLFPLGWLISTGPYSNDYDCFLVSNNYALFKITFGRNSMISLVRIDGFAILHGNTGISRWRHTEFDGTEFNLLVFVNNSNVLHVYFVFR